MFYQQQLGETTPLMSSLIMRKAVMRWINRVVGQGFDVWRGWASVKAAKCFRQMATGSITLKAERACLLEGIQTEIHQKLRSRRRRLPIVVSGSGDGTSLWVDGAKVGERVLNQAPRNQALAVGVAMAAPGPHAARVARVCSGCARGVVRLWRGGP